ncbi:hypothetical protein DSO57_1007239 [Entomophthora muscae]|uniref:Uncharacterized protein n=1 Tax=Entomophthora muscae TaxID=34485 RepID=A0ACC2UGF4_9FUNG|nr:hypothetical protein DSO57_1007239 [Entomophthora muscae]
MVRNSRLCTSLGNLLPTSALGWCLTRSYTLWWTPSLIGDTNCRALNMSLWSVQTTRPSVTSASPRSCFPCQARVMQTLSGYKFKYEFVKGELNIFPDLLSHNPAMYLVRGNKDPQVTVIPESSVLPVPGPSPSHTPATASAAPSQLLAIGPAPSLEASPPLALSGTLLYDVLVAQHSSPDGWAICAKLSPDSASNGPYTLNDRIIYQNDKVWVPKELRPHVMTEYHDPPLFGHPSSKKLLKLIRCTYS